MLSPQLLAGGAALALLAGLLGGWTARGIKADADQFHALERADKREDAARQQELDQGTAYARFSADNQQHSTADRNTIRETYREIHVPSDCAVAPAAVGVLENGVSRANAAASGSAGTAMPEPGAATGATDRSGPGAVGG